MQHVAFRWDGNAHEYVDLGGVVRPHITQLLEKAGLVDDRWYTEESCERGSCVHRLTADYDLGALDPDTCVSKYRGYLLAHVAAMRMLQPTFTHIEVPLLYCHEGISFGGRPDRCGKFYGCWGVLEGKSGVATAAHPVQTALQAMLFEPECGIPADFQLRLCLYWKDNGKFTIEQHQQKRDFAEARRILSRYARL